MREQVKIISFVHEDFEDLELWYPILRLREEGFQVDLVGEKAGHEYHGKYGVPATAEYAFEEVKAADYDGLLVPGGWAPDKLRRFDAVLEIVRSMDAAKKPIGEICHAGWVLSSAGILKGRKVTSTPGIKDDMMHAGAHWENQPVVVDENIVSGRWPKDLPYYVKAFIELF